jgi:DinB family protein
MQATLKPIAHLYGTTDRLVGDIVSRLEEDDLVHAPEEWNSVLRLWGHLAVVRHRLLNALTGQQEPIPFEESCGWYPTGDPLPSREEVDAAYAAVTEQLQAAFDALSDEDLAGPGRGQGVFPTDDETLLGTIAFLGYHEAYTVGQMGYVGHLIGKLPRTGVLG